jgi:ketosteroid isomerase-like protein
MLDSGRPGRRKTPSGREVQASLARRWYLFGSVPASQLDLVRKAFAAYNRGDIDDLLELMAEDVVAVIPSGLPNDGIYHGRDGFLEMLGAWEEAWEEFRIEPIEFIEEGDAVIVPIRQFGRGRGSGIETEMELTQLMRVRSGRFVQWRLCWDRAEALAHARAG